MTKLFLNFHKNRLAEGKTEKYLKFAVYEIGLVTYFDGSLDNINVSPKGHEPTASIITEKKGNFFFFH